MAGPRPSHLDARCRAKAGRLAREVISSPRCRARSGRGCAAHPGRSAAGVRPSSRGPRAAAGDCQRPARGRHRGRLISVTSPRPRRLTSSAEPAATGSRRSASVAGGPTAAAWAGHSDGGAPGPAGPAPSRPAPGPAPSRAGCFFTEGSAPELPVHLHYQQAVSLPLLPSEGGQHMMAIYRDRIASDSSWSRRCVQQVHQQEAPAPGSSMPLTVLTLFSVTSGVPSA